jgi:large subunit ribosomal protein L32
MHSAQFAISFPETTRHSTEEITMAVPKRRTSKRKKRARNTHKTAPAIAIQKCPRCQSMKRPHHVCEECGYYDGVERVPAREA